MKFNAMVLKLNIMIPVRNYILKFYNGKNCLKIKKIHSETLQPAVKNIEIVIEVVTLKSNAWNFDQFYRFSLKK